MSRIHEQHNQERFHPLQDSHSGHAAWPMTPAAWYGNSGLDAITFIAAALKGADLSLALLKTGYILPTRPAFVLCHESGESKVCFAT